MRFTEVYIYYHVEFTEISEAINRGMTRDDEQKLWYFSTIQKLDNLNVDKLFNMMKNDEGIYFKFKVDKIRGENMKIDDINRFEKLCKDHFMELFNENEYLQKQMTTLHYEDDSFSLNNIKLPDIFYFWS
jgi:hypothetical protein